MDPSTILTVLSIVETLAKTSIQMYQNYKTMQNIDPNSIDLDIERQLQEALDKSIELRMQVREHLIKELERQKDQQS